MKKREQELRVKLDQIMKNLFSVSSQVLINMLNSLFQEDYDPENNDYDMMRGDVFFPL